MVRYQNGHAQIAAPSGDLLLSAPRGNVVVQSEDALQVDCPRVDLKTQHARVAAGDLLVTLVDDQQKEAFSQEEDTDAYGAV